MIRGNLDYAFIQPIRKVMELDALWELFGGQHFEKKEWRQFIKEVATQRTLDGSTAAEPLKEVRVLVIADFETANIPEDMFFWWKPDPMSDLAPFRLMHPQFWKEQEGLSFSGQTVGKISRIDPVEQLEQVNSVLADVPTI